VRNAAGLARYVVKDVKDQSDIEPPPPTFRGRLLSYSRHFLAAPMRHLWTALRAEWFARREGADG
jgi:hypothetical protein